MARPLRVKKVHPSSPIETAAVRILGTRLKEFYSHWPDPRRTPDAAQLHNLRISGKRLRYSAEGLRDLYPDRLALLIDLLKRGQDLLGVMQDCETQRMAVEREIATLRRRDAQQTELSVLERLALDYRQRQALLLEQFREIWLGMTIPEFRKSLRAMIARPGQIRPRKPASEEAGAPPSTPLHLVTRD
ncbi:MAG: CHAD domain-containing protein [Blastocatellia bacterium]|nr:CHAD domain-containing protein [Blastocatellia bacterium]